jgi:type IV pilus assembly protein PilC
MEQGALKSFEYTGVDRYQKRVKGVIKAKSLFEAKAELRGKKIKLPIIRQVKAVVPNKSSTLSKFDIQINIPFFEGVSNKELLFFTKKLATMVSSGLPIIESLMLAKDQVKSSSFKKILGKIIESVNAGSLLSDAFDQFPKHFEQVYRNMVRAGEVTGRLDTFLDRIVYNLERTDKIQSGIKSALYYPAALVIVSLIVMYFMLTKVVPTFQGMYSKMGATLPSSTQFLVDASNWILDSRNFGGLVFVFAMLYLFNKLMLVKVYPYRFFVHAAMLKIPLFGDLIIKSTVARLALLMANLFSAGIGINEILKIASSNSSNLLFIEAQKRIAERVVTGVELSTLFTEEALFPADLPQLIRVGERTGRMEDMLNAVSKYYQEEFESVVKGLTSVIEPLMIVFVGGIIGVLVLALYMPIFNLGSTVK